MRSVCAFFIFCFFVLSCIAQNNFDFLIRAAEAGDIQAQKYLAKCYITGEKDYIPKNLSEGYKWIVKVAEQGDSLAQYELAINDELKPYVDGQGLGQLYWLERASNSGHPNALQLYGEYLYTNKQFDKAISVLQRAVMKGHSLLSAYYLGLCYKYGYGVKVDAKMAAQHFDFVIKVSETVNKIEGEFVISAYFESAQNYMFGNGIERDYDRAIYNINKALKNTSYSKGNRNYSLLLDTKGGIYLLMGHDNEAKQIWNEISRSDPSFSKESKTFFNMAMTENVDYFIPSSNGRSLNTYAIVIANENYKRVPNVPYAINDGKIFYKYLMSSFGVPEGNIEYLEDASLNDIKYALNNVAQRCQAFKDQCSVIVYYAGHGVPDDKTAEAFLLPVDGFGTDPSSGLNLDDFYATLSEMQAKSVVVLLDACFSGAKRDGGMLMATRGITIKPKMHVPDGKLIVLSATSNEETAFPIEDQKHGLFTYTLLRKIQETGGDITWGELADHVTETVKNRSIDLNGKLQTPTVSVSSSMKEIWRNLKLR